MRKNKQGFTIIEVVLVLAIGGLIFLMVFIALPSLNASQRDTQRRQDSAIIAAAVRDFMKHNHNNVPPSSTYKIESTDNGDSTTTNSFGGNAASKAFMKYLVDLDPGGVTNKIVVSEMPDKNTIGMWVVPENIKIDTVYIVPGVKCISEESQNNTQKWEVEITRKRSNVAIMRHLEKGYWHCLDT